MGEALRTIHRWLWRWDVLAAYNFGLIFAGGYAAFFGVYVRIGTAAILLGLALFLFKALSWDETKKAPSRAWLSVFLVTLTLVLAGMAIFFAHQRFNDLSSASVSVSPQAPPLARVQGNVESVAPAAGEVPRAKPQVKSHAPASIARSEITPQAPQAPQASAPPPATFNCTGSNCIGGDNYGNPTVINGSRPMSISPGDWTVVEAAMRPFAGRKIRIDSSGFSQGTITTARALRQALAHAGLVLDPLSADAMIYANANGPAPPGFSFTASDDQMDALATLGRELAGIGGLLDGEKAFPARRASGVGILEVVVGPVRE